MTTRSYTAEAGVPQVDAAVVAIINEALVEAEQRMTSKREHAAPSRCPHCGRRVGPFTAGHVYAIIFVVGMLLITIMGALVGSH